MKYLSCLISKTSITLKIIPRKKVPAIYEDVEIFLNPTKKELRQYVKEQEEGYRKEGAFAGFLLSNGDILVWDRYAALHQGIVETMNIGKDVIPFEFYLGQDGVEITDNIQRTIYNRERHKVPEVVKKSKRLKQIVQIAPISYYDEAIRGKWDGVDLFGKEVWGNIKKYSSLKKQSGKIKEKLLNMYERQVDPDKVSFEEWYASLEITPEMYSAGYTDVPVKTWDKKYHETSQPWDLDNNYRNTPETTGKDNGNTVSPLTVVKEKVFP